MDYIFSTKAPFIITINVVLLHWVGYLLQHYLPELALEAWCIVALIDALMGYRCGRYILNVYTDTLTQLRNRSFFYLFLNNELKNLKAERKPLSVMLLDIDDFKQINDTHGHLAGDEVLKQFARLLRQNVRKNDCIVRWGGEEFIIVLPGTDIAAARQMGERIRQAIQEHTFGETLNLQLTASLGVISIDNHADISSIIKRVDAALYSAKKQKNTVVVYV